MSAPKKEKSARNAKLSKSSVNNTTTISSGDKRETLLHSRNTESLLTRSSKFDLNDPEVVRSFIKKNDLMINKIPISFEMTHCLYDILARFDGLQRVVIEKSKFEESGVINFVDGIRLMQDSLKSIEVSFAVFGAYPDSLFSGLIDVCATSKNCRSLNFRFTNLNDNSLGVLLNLINMDKLTSLDLTSTFFSKEAFVEICSALNTCSKIKLLKLGGIAEVTGNEYATQLDQIMENNPKLKKIAISDVELDSYTSMNIIALSLKKSRIVTLDLSRTTLDADSIQVLSTAITGHPSLKELILSGNSFTEDGIHSLQTAFIFNTTITKLVLKRCFLDRHDTPGVFVGDADITISTREISDAFHALIEMIEENETIEELDLKDNYFTDDHMLLLSKALKVNSTIKSLNLSYNPINIRGIGYLCSALVNNNGIQSLDLRGITIEESSAKSLIWSLGWNKTLNHISFGKTPSKILKEAIYSELKERKDDSATEPIVATKEDIDQIVDIIVKNNVDTNSRFIHMLGMVEEDEKREKVCRRLVKKSVKWAQKYNSCYIIQMKKENLGNTILGATVWIPPDVKIQAPVGAFIQASVATLMDVGVKSVSRIKTVVNRVEQFSKEHAPPTGWKLMYFEVNQHYYELDVIWTSIFKEVLEFADRDAQPIFTYVTKRDSLRVLELLGFEIIKEDIIDGEVPIWGLIREPQPL